MIDVTQDPRAFLTKLFSAAVGAADPHEAIKANLPQKPRGRTIVVGAGKASVQMAIAFESLWEGPIEGLVVTTHGTAARCRRIEVIEASHPVPDAFSLNAAQRLLNLVSGLTADDLVVALISGGGSALLAAPAPSLTLADEIAVGKALLASGAPISAMNVVRTQLSTIKGGRLALAAYPAKVATLIVSDVPGDDPGLVASGPTVAGWSTHRDALEVIKRYRIELPRGVMDYLSAPAEQPLDSNHPCFTRNDVHVVASAATSLEAAAEMAREMGIPAVILSDAVEGEAREIAKVHAAVAKEILRKGRPFRKPVVLLSGGESTVTLRGNGRGGRNTEFLLSLASEIAECTGIFGLAADTDGIDGSQDNAGAFADASSVARLNSLGRDAKGLLTKNDAWTAFDALGDIFHTGPTGTNVNDFRAILVV